MIITVLAALQDVWDAPTKKYDTKEIGAMKYVVNHNLKYQMFDEKYLEAQSMKF